MGTRDYWKHSENGRIYAIEYLTFGRMLGACGPLDPEALPALEDCCYGPDLLIWVETEMADGNLRRYIPASAKEPVAGAAKLS